MKRCQRCLHEATISVVCAISLSHPLLSLSHPLLSRAHLSAFTITPLCNHYHTLYHYHTPLLSRAHPSAFTITPLCYHYHTLYHYHTPLRSLSHPCAITITTLCYHLSHPSCFGQNRLLKEKCLPGGIIPRLPLLVLILYSGIITSREVQRRHALITPL